MDQRTWPGSSQGSRSSIIATTNSSLSSSTPPNVGSNFANLLSEILEKIAWPFSLRDLHAASLVCKSWSKNLRPLMETIRLGRLFKHGGPDVQPDFEKALDCFLKGVANGSTAAMVEAGIVYWEMGDNEKAANQFRRAAELGDAVGQYYLGTYYNIRAQPTNWKESRKWFKKSAENGYMPAQFQLALRVNVNTNMGEPAEWFRWAANYGFVSGIYYLSSCYSRGRDGVRQSDKQARKCLKKAADHGYSQALLDLGLALLSEWEMKKAAMYLALAERGGETEATYPRQYVFQHLDIDTRISVINKVINWRPHCKCCPTSSNLSYYRM